MKAEIISIGDELLIGQIINTNQAYIAERISALGVRVGRMVTVRDDIGEIMEAFGQAATRADVVLATGGLGPTHDDVTKKAACRFFGTELEVNRQVRETIARQLEARGAAWSPAAEEQTMFPKTAGVIPNNRGSAAGMLFEEDDRMYIIMPGVPYEMTGMMDEFVVPLIGARRHDRVVSHRTLRTTGVSESVLAEQLGDLERLLQGADLAFLPSPTGVRLRITVEASARAEADAKAVTVEERIRAIVQKHVYGTGDEELEGVVGQLLASKGLTIAVAESCTGGLITDKLTDVSGSSAYLLRGIVAYSDSSKESLLGVPPDLLKQYGAVSRQVAVAMAEGVRRTGKTDIGLSTTGIAGPSGGSPEKPVGLVWIGLADHEGSLALKFRFGPDRRRIKERAAAAGLELVRRRVLRL